MARLDDTLTASRLSHAFGHDGEAERPMRDLLNALPVAIYTTDAVGRITFYNDAAAILWGCRPKLNSDLWCGSWKLYWPDGTPLPHDECPMAIAIKEQRHINGKEAVAERPDGTRVPFMAFPSPLLDAAGKTIGAVNMLVDISERKNTEQAAQFLASIVSSSEDAIISKDLNGTITTWNDAAQRLFGYTADEMVGRPIALLIPAERLDEEPKILDRIRRGERIEHYETIRRRKDGSLVEISITVSPVKDGAGRIVGASKIARDITERKRDEERIRLLVREVDHRAKNLLALVQATVHLSQGATPAELKTAIEGRLRAIASAHSLFAQSRWEGANLRTLVGEELAPFSPNRGGRVFYEGPDMVLIPGAAQSFAVVLHELTTNAAKYGALSGKEGQVRVTWSCPADGGLVFSWQERGGPATHAPTTTGFGMKVMKQLVQRQMGGAVTFDWDPAGLTCAITMPPVRAQPGGEAGPAG